MLDEDMVFSELWQLYHTDDAEKMDRFFKALVGNIDLDDLEECINAGWGDEEQ
ncbi:hypothetical protein GCM10022297_01400 [Lactobacillus hamsteri]|uniref:Uncharacterized protein n=1 Tax=Lactobacillus hamsteri DSM 5661 = JCM 6256 TaxID=1423754 RepID=A0A0R1Y3Z4_9LACO|nr:hypothetical protein [Lactobacillus hamsteri]KRM37024.1 hypothetical protein FC39_GL000476 [Lactobacillus hamsteri DSM 5661 = JCM 6256]